MLRQWLPKTRNIHGIYQFCRLTTSSVFHLVFRFRQQTQSSLYVQSKTR